MIEIIIYAANGKKRYDSALNICYQLNFLICLLNVNTVWLVLFLVFFFSRSIRKQKKIIYCRQSIKYSKQLPKQTYKNTEIQILILWFKATNTHNTVNKCLLPHYLRWETSFNIIQCHLHIDTYKCSDWMRPPHKHVWYTHNSVILFKVRLNILQHRGHCEIIKKYLILFIFGAK